MHDTDRKPWDAGLYTAHRTILKSKDSAVRSNCYSSRQSGFVSTHPNSSSQSCVAPGPVDLILSFDLYSRRIYDTIHNAQKQ